jgi:hypothetical protein
MSYHLEQLHYSADVNRERRVRVSTLSKHLRGKRLGFCPWCNTALSGPLGFQFCPRLACADYDSMLSEHDNRARYVQWCESIKDGAE